MRSKFVPLDAAIKGMTLTELSELSTAFYAEGGDVQELMNIAALGTVTPAGMHLLASAFGEQYVLNAIGASWSASGQGVYASLGPVTPISASLSYRVQVKGQLIPNPQVNWALSDVYLEFRTCGFTVTESLIAMARWAQGDLFIAYLAGKAIGNLVLLINPNIPSDIAGWVCDYTCPGIPAGIITIEPIIPPPPMSVTCGDGFAMCITEP